MSYLQLRWNTWPCHPRKTPVEIQNITGLPWWSAGSVGSIPGPGAKIPHASSPRSQNINNKSNTVTNSIETFKKIQNTCAKHDAAVLYSKVQALLPF